MIPPSRLYWSPHSYQSTVVRLCLEEKIYSSRDLDLIQVDLNMGDNFHPSFLAINPAGTLPVLLVPNAESIKADRAVEYTRISDTNSILKFLSIKRRSIPSLIPLPHLINKSDEFINYLLSGEVDTNFLMLSATSSSELELNSTRAISYLISRQTAFDRYRHLCPADRRNWFESKSKSNMDILDIYRYRYITSTSTQYPNDNIPSNIDKPVEDILKYRQDFFNAGKKTWSNVASFLIKVDNELSSNTASSTNEQHGPWLLGHDLTLVDLHIVAFLARVIADINGSMDDEGLLKLLNIIGLNNCDNLRVSLSSIAIFKLDTRLTL